ncbi:MAG: OmpA family protein [Acidobacteriota bacterium]|nr:OmpA family protein [Acidobacteriota bacterium]
MIQGRARSPIEDDEQPNFWASYSDLMAGMLLVFILLLVVALFHYADFTRKKEEVLESQESRLKSFHELKKRLVGTLAEEMKGEEVALDPDSGVLRIGSGILFGEGEANLQDEGRVRLHRVFDAYIKVVLDNEFRNVIRQIEIEGHTNSNGTYLFNLQLSQQRALTVMQEMLDRVDPSQRVRLQQIVVAGGRSFAHLIYDKDGIEDKELSRRIEIHVRLKESELFQDIYKDLVTE